MLTDAELEATAFYLRATAGVRLLERSDPELVTALMEAVVNASGSQPLLNGGNADAAAILSGGDEGAFGWTAANYLGGTLDPAVEALQSGGGMRAVRQLQTTGALDLGGASTQISFVPGDGQQPQPEDEVRLDLYGNVVELYAHSYLCYGINQARLRREVVLLGDGSNDLVEDPCLPHGYSKTFSVDDITALVNSDCLVGYINPELPVKPYTLAGADREGAADCNATVQGIFDDSTGGGIETFATGRARQPQLPASQIYAFSSYWFTIEFLFRGTGSACVDQCTPTLIEIAARSEVICNMTYDELKATYPTVDGTFLIGYCDASLYIQELLGRYGVAPEARTVVYAGKVQGTGVGWNFGFAINATRGLPSLVEAGAAGTADPVLVGAAAASGTGLLVLVCYGIVLGRRRSFGQNSNNDERAPLQGKGDWS